MASSRSDPSRSQFSNHWFGSASSAPDDLYIIGITPILSNKSDAPAPYSVVLIYVDERIEAQHPSYDVLAATLIDNNHAIPYRLSFFPGKVMPIFKEQPTLMPPLGLVIPEEHLRRSGEYYIGYEIRAPGCHAMGSGRLSAEYGHFLTVQMGG